MDLNYALVAPNGVVTFGSAAWERGLISEIHAAVSPTGWAETGVVNRGEELMMCVGVDSTGTNHAAARVIAALKHDGYQDTSLPSGPVAFYVGTRGLTAMTRDLMRRIKDCARDRGGRS